MNIVGARNVPATLDQPKYFDEWTNNDGRKATRHSRDLCIDVSVVEDRMLAGLMRWSHAYDSLGLA